MNNPFTNVHVSVPFFLLRDQYLSLILSNQIQPEIGLDCRVLDAFPLEDFKRVARELSQAGLNCSFHGPFLDLSLGAIDSRIRQVSLERFEQVFELISIFQPRWVVCHAAYEERHYGDNQEEWLNNILTSLFRLLPQVEKTKTLLMVENVFEKNTEHLSALFQAVSSPLLRFCLDVGHHRLFSRTSLREWIDQLGPVLGMLHLHDNHGRLDDHLALGQGSIDFQVFFALLKERGLHPFITLEPHQEDWVRQSLEFLVQHWIETG
jgi:sugar phosphate isomerase/epimerase